MTSQPPEITIYEMDITDSGHPLVSLHITSHNIRYKSMDTTYDLGDMVFINADGSRQTDYPLELRKPIDAAVLEGLTAKTLKIYETNLGGERREVAAEDYPAEDLIEVLKRSIAS